LGQEFDNRSQPRVTLDQQNVTRLQCGAHHARVGREKRRVAHRRMLQKLEDFAAEIVFESV
jgi:hypothetical protein